ncbi:MAG: hypothetical protein ACRCW9_03170 [Cetobacterium sp.]
MSYEKEIKESGFQVIQVLYLTLDLETTRYTRSELNETYKSRMGRFISSKVLDFVVETIETDFKI